MRGLTRGGGKNWLWSIGIPKKRTRCRVRWDPVLYYLLYIIQRQGVLTPKNVLHFSSSKIYFLSSSLVVVDFHINPHVFLKNDSEIHQKNITSNSTRIIVFLLFFPYAPCGS